MSDLLRVYLDPSDIRSDGYPHAWHEPTGGAIKDWVRTQAGNRCVRCHHPYAKGAGEWSACDDHCRHDGPVRVWSEFGRNAPPSETITGVLDFSIADSIDGGFDVDAQWRILTVHHLNGIKHDCRWWNLVALCQRCHLSVQGRVVMDRVWPWEHSDWFKPYAAGWYAWAYLGEELTRDEAMARMDELLGLERA